MTTSEGKSWDARYLTDVPHDASYYSKCMLSGALACGTTHAGITPLDVAKVSMQVNSQKYTNSRMAVRLLLKEEGSTGIWKGFGPAFAGYWMQGMFKYGLYEVFKDLYMNMAGQELGEKYKPLIWLAGSASAEVVADVALCPLEMTKVKVQSSPSGTFPTKFGPALREMSRLRAETRYPFGSLVPIWSRQIPYTMAKFFCFEGTVQLFYTHVFTSPKDTYSPVTQLGITFASGYIAGIVSAVVSHPADSLVSQLSKSENKGKSFSQIINEVGWGTLATKGLGARVFMIGTLTGLQWWIYDSAKTAMGLGTTGGK